MALNAAAAPAWRDVSVDGFAERIASRTASGIANEVRSEIHAGRIRPGTRLPAIRDVARALEVSPTTVQEAWNQLTRAGMLRASGRRGTLVLPVGSRVEVQTPSGVLSVDRADGEPDPALFPPLEQAVLAGVRSPDLHAFDFAFVTPALLGAVRRTWPFRAEAWTTADGGWHGNFLGVQAVLTAGRPVAVEQPTMMRTLTLLDHLKVPMIGVDWDGEGPSPAMLRAALRRGARAFVYQPRGHVPTGGRVTEQRLEELAEVLARHPEVQVFEDDTLGPLLAGRDLSLGALLPGQVLRQRSYCAAFGLDLRTSVLAGPEHLVRAVNRIRGMSGVWNSRVLQDALAHLLRDGDTRRLVERAGRRYRRRRTALVAALADRGVQVGGEDGLIVWLPVVDEERAFTGLAHAGVETSMGSTSWISPRRREQHLRVATGRLAIQTLEIEYLADSLARFARA
ncbi:aminotransferase class I/II-fold pyridoxal phosphate-dependent enzyme [Phytohabitans sp. ZYX-F-186]|uniref:Aminotransferase class I/II-fold pyridoxal phosphate-dependent enzyme n=1 Tax=Phytohabitans maris TaxID=3071409 RepID=A0ABU0ZDW0_9ACTN|nr:aminotransferase class I/II-fold pyridoxal phosphate-dependent enzyme [Phytohabitans sp. ZYX-F-186]MDQ7905138.1 aminotransferase class I/II-fold pyridoxal phosphate-dependent enzyme [Phytohabitans sp. ZYX-F-186]